MDPNEFFFLILPLAALVSVLVVVVLYLARREDNIRHKEVEALNELMQTGIITKENFYMLLRDLAKNKMIKDDSRDALGKLVEESFEDEQA